MIKQVMQHPWSCAPFSDLSVTDESAFVSLHLMIHHEVSLLYLKLMDVPIKVDCMFISIILLWVIFHFSICYRKTH